MTDGGPLHWGAPLHAAVLDGTGVRPGTRVLDLGCGPGLLARAAVERGARVTGVDADVTAVRRAAAEVPQARFCVGDAAHPPPGPFDVVTAVQLLMHVGDPVAVLRAAGRSGAVVGATVWGSPAECDVRAFGEALAPWLGPSRPAPRTPALTDPARLREVAERSGLAVDRVDEVVCPFDYADEAAVLGPLLDSAMGRAARRRADPTVLRSAVLRRLEPYRTASGGYRLRNTFRVLIARPA